jgi:hypothetical protein
MIIFLIICNSITKVLWIANGERKNNGFCTGVLLGVKLTGRIVDNSPKIRCKSLKYAVYFECYYLEKIFGGY